MAHLDIVFGRYFGSSILTDVMSDFRVDDIIYVNLPLYHTAGGTLGMGQMIVNGKTVVLARKFSARQFWKDCIKNKCTVSQRYLYMYMPLIGSTVFPFPSTLFIYVPFHFLPSIASQCVY